MTQNMTCVRDLELEKLLTTGSRIASVKLSGGDICRFSKSALHSRLRLGRENYQRSKNTLKTCIRTQNAVGLRKEPLRRVDLHNRQSQS